MAHGDRSPGMDADLNELEECTEQEARSTASSCLVGLAIVFICAVVFITFIIHLIFF